MSAIIKGSIGQIAKDSGKTIAETFINADAVVLVDTSGSMSTQDAPGGVSRYEAACKELAGLQTSLPGKVAVLSFSDTVQFCPTGTPTDLRGGTDLAGALRFAKMADVPGMRFVVISDGEPESRDLALTVARTYTNKIDTIYIGSELQRAGRDFLESLARASGGVHVTTGAAGLGALGQTVERLLLATG